MHPIRLLLCAARAACIPGRAWVLLAVWAAAVPVGAQNLQDSGLELPGVWAGQAAWGDYDGDGDADLILIGEIRNADGSCSRIARVLRNDGGLLVEDVAQSGRLVGAYFGDTDWADYDGDGDLDLAVAGWDDAGDESLRLYTNDEGAGDRELTLDLNQVDLQGVRYADLAWGDADRDGDLDLVVSGMNANGFSSTRLYLNDRGTFALDEFNSEALLNVHSGELAWGDYDNDGDLDLAVAGENVHAEGGIRRVSEFYVNEPTGSLSLDVGLTSAAKVNGGALAWGDYDNDGNLDLAQSGRTETWSTVLQLFLNRPAGTLTVDPTFALTAFLRVDGDLDWVDYDNDGDLDLAASGRTILSDRRAFVFENRDGEVSAVSAETSVEGLAGGAAVWGDNDGDGRVDLLLSGVDAGGQRRTVLYTNSVAAANRAPDPPATLSAVTVTSHRVLFSWSSAEDLESPVLSYNLRLGTEPGIGDVLSTEVPLRSGNVGFKTSYVLARALAPDTYFWSVQAVDGGLARSEFSTEGQFVVGRFVSSDQSLRGMNNSAMSWGDVDGDGDVDLALMGTNRSGEAQTLVYVNHNGLLGLDTGAGLTALTDGDLVWGDYDGDGDLDLFTSGHIAEGNRADFLYQVTVATDDSLRFDQVLRFRPDLDASAAAWGDIDLDGDLDLVYGGQSGEVEDGVQLSFTRVWTNDGAGSFEQRDDGLTGLNNGDLDLGDVDGDGDLDLLVTGVSSTGERRTDLYSNELDGGLVDAGAGLEGLESSDLALADYDRDGDLDLALGGITATDAAFAALYDNDAGAFVLSDLVPLPGIQGGDLAWADYDNDQDVDLIVAGNDGAAAILQVWENTIGQAAPDVPFELASVPVLVGVDFSAVSMADPDGDGDLDLFSSGRTVGLAPTTVVNDNLTAQQANANLGPAPPGQLTAADSADAVVLTWAPGSDVFDPPAASLTYGVRVGKTPGAHDVLSAAPVQGRGNAGHSLSRDLFGLDSGTYFWSVQTVDVGFTGSRFAAEQAFVIDTVAPTVAGVTLNRAAVGLGQTVTLALEFADEHAGMDPSVAPSVEAVVDGAPMPFTTLKFTGATWSGELIVGDDTFSGDAGLSVRGARDVKGNELTAFDSVGAFRIDAERPAVVARTPAAGAADVTAADDAGVTVGFSEPLDESTVTPANFVLRRGRALAETELRYDGEGPSVTLTTDLTPGSEYTVEVSAAVADLAGNRTDDATTWSFQTRVPVLVETTPAAGAAGVSVGEDRITAAFDAAVLDTVLRATDAVQVLREGERVDLEPAVFDEESLTLSFETEDGLRPGSRYEVVLISLLGGPLRAVSEEGDFRWSFTTAVPNLVSSVPSGDDSTVTDLAQSVVATFDNAIDLSQLAQDGAVRLLEEGEEIALREAPVFDVDTSALRFAPAGGLRPGARYQVVLAGLLGGPQRVAAGGDYRYNFSTAVPNLVSSVPSGDDSTVTDLEQSVVATFDNAIDLSQLAQDGAVRLLEEGEEIELREAPVFDVEASALRFAPAGGLRPGARYQVVLAGLLGGPQRVAAGGDYRYNFSTAVPVLVSTQPAADDSTVTDLEQSLVATFDNTIDVSQLAQVGAVALLKEGEEIALREQPVFDTDTGALRFAPAGGLRPGARYQVVLAGLLGGPQRVAAGGDYRYGFSTAVPALESTQPAADDSTVTDLEQSVVATFDNAIDLSQLAQDGAVRLLEEGEEVALRETPVFDTDAGALRLAPAGGLRPGARYQVVLAGLLGGPKRVGGDGDYRFGFATAVPSLVSTQPAADDSTVTDLEQSVVVTFDNTIDVSHLAQVGAVALLEEGEEIALREQPVFDTDTGALRFAPAGGLRPGARYLVTLSAQLGGPRRGGDGDYGFSFATAVPGVVSLSPTDGDTLVTVDQSGLVATFDSGIDQQALLRAGSVQVFREGQVAEVTGPVWDEAAGTLTVAPAEGLRAGTSYRVEVSSDVRGPRADADVTWSFVTLVPRVVSTDPADGSSVPAGPRRVQVRFSSAVDRELLRPGNLRLIGGGRPIRLSLEEFLYDTDTFTASLPLVDLVSGSSYGLVISSRIGGPASVESDREVQFTTDVPTVVSADPEAGAEGISTTQATLTIAFSGPIARQGPRGFSLRARGLDAVLTEGADAVPFEIVPITGFGTDSTLTVVSFAAEGGLAPFTEYEVSIEPPVFGGLAEEGLAWRFSTAARLASAAEGGTVASPDRSVEIYLPPNALSGGSGEIVIATIPDGAGKPAVAPAQDLVPVGPAYLVSAGTAVLRKPATLTLRYTTDDIGGSNPARVGVFALSGGQWVRVGGTADPAALAVTTSVDEFGTFGLFEDLATPFGSLALRDIDCQPRAFAPAGGDLRAETDISFELTAAADVTVRVYNAAGRLERVVVRDRPMSPGRNSLAWDGRDEDADVVASGLYVVVVSAGSAQAEKVVAVVR